MSKKLVERIEATLRAIDSAPPFASSPSKKHISVSADYYTEILQDCKAALSQQGAVELRYTHDGALAECPCCGSLDVGGAGGIVNCYNCELTITRKTMSEACSAWNVRKAPPSTAQGDPEEIRERVARIINTKGYEKLHCIVGQKGAEDIRFLVDCLRGV